MNHDYVISNLIINHISTFGGKILYIYKEMVSVTISL